MGYINKEVFINNCFKTLGVSFGGITFLRYFGFKNEQGSITYPLLLKQSYPHHTEKWIKIKPKI